MTKTTTNDECLELHVIGGTKGESIVLKFPTESGPKWGVVDCYASTLDNPQTNPALVFLNERNVEQLEFLCLTHPHEDHFRGMSYLFDFSPRYFWRFNGLNPKQFVDLVQILAADQDDPDAFENADELKRIASLARQSSKAGTLRRKRVVIREQLYPERHDVLAPLQIWGLAPFGDQVARYEEKFASCFDKRGVCIRCLPNSHHNIVSAALLVQFGETRIILGGDVETKGWEDVIAEHECTDLSSHAVKVSHHGSTNGYCEGLWACFSKTNEPVAIIAPYRRFSLPRRTAIEHIRQFAAYIVVTSNAGMPTVGSGGSLKSRLALRSQINAVAEPNPDYVGRCSFVLDPRGRCVKRILKPPATLV